MYAGRTMFAQLMDFLPWTSFCRLVERYGGDCRVRALSCADQYRAMAFAQLSHRESLRDIETCLSAQASKLYHMGFRGRVRRSTLADANERRDWRIYADLAQRLIDVLTVDLVVQGIETETGFCLRFRVQRRLQFLNALRS